MARGKKAPEAQGSFINFESPATSLADYYGMLAKVLRNLGRARSNATGFTKLSDSSKPVKIYSERLSTDPDQTKHIVGKNADMYRMRAQDALFKFNGIEYKKVIDYAGVTDAFTAAEINESFGLPPSIDEIEFRFYDNPDVEQHDLELQRQAIYRREDAFAKKEAARVA